MIALIKNVLLPRTHLLPGDKGPHSGEAWDPWQGQSRRRASFRPRLRSLGLEAGAPRAPGPCEIGLSVRTELLMTSPGQGPLLVILYAASYVTGEARLGWIRYEAEEMSSHLSTILYLPRVHPVLSSTLTSCKAGHTFLSTWLAFAKVSLINLLCDVFGLLSMSLMHESYLPTGPTRMQKSSPVLYTEHHGNRWQHTAPLWPLEKCREQPSDTATGDQCHG